MNIINFVLNTNFIITKSAKTLNCLEFKYCLSSIDQNEFFVKLLIKNYRF